MKTFIGVVCMATMLTNPQAYGLFGHTDEERQRRIAVEQQLSQERQRLDTQQRSTVEQERRANRWQTTAFMLSIVVVLSLIVGVAIGSKGRHHAATGK